MRLLLGIFLFASAVTLPAKNKPPLAPEIASAKSIYLLARLGPVGNGAYAPDLQRATAQVTEILQKWGRFAIASDPAKADLVLLITEGHYGSVTLLNGSVNGNYASGTAQDVAVLGDILQVYKGGALPDDKSLPLWTRVETGGYTWPAKRAANRFKKEVQEYDKR